MTAKNAAQPYPGSDAPGTPGGSGIGAVTIRPATLIPASRATPVGQDFDTSDPAPGVVLVSGAAPPELPTGGAAPGGPLENYANSSPPPPDLRRYTRYERRSALWSLSGLSRLRKCGKVTRSEGGSVGVRVGNGVAGFSGLCTCGSVWACPVCNAKVMARRRLELQSMIALHQADGGRVIFGTLTLRHHAGQPLGTLWDAVAKSWSYVTSSAPWERLKARHGILGFARVVEVTQGANGWHVHIHYLLFVPGSTTSGDVDQIHGRLFARWVQAVTSRGLAAPLWQGQEAHLVESAADVHLSEYLVKQTDLGWEMTGAAYKTRGKTAPVWALLSEVLEDGDADALDRWHEWEKSSKGRRMLTVSHGLRDRLLVEEKSDDEIAAEVYGDEDLVLIDADGWASLVARPHLIPRVLTAAETGGVEGLRSFLSAHGVTHAVVI